MLTKKIDYEPYYRSARLQVCNKFQQFWTILSKLNHFLYLSRSILVYLYLSWFILVYLGSAWFILIYFDLSLSISVYLELLLEIFWATLGYLKLSWALSEYNELYRLSLAISGNCWLYMVISSYLYRVSSIRVQVEAGESNLLLFQFLSFFTRASSRGARAPNKHKICA